MPHATELALKVVQETSSQILGQLKELISRGLIVIETDRPKFVLDTNGELTVGISVRLLLKDQEYIQSLEKQVADLREMLARVRSDS